MKTYFSEINNLNIKSKTNKSLALCKLGEEIGELYQQINIDLGIKTGNKLLVRDGVKEELADSIQNLFSIAHLYNITFEELSDELYKKNNKWYNVLKDKQ